MVVVAMMMTFPPDDGGSAVLKCRKQDFEMR